MSSFEQFIEERKFIKNVSQATVYWYGDIQRHFPNLDISSASAFRQSVMCQVKELLARGIQPVSVRSWLSGLRAYGYWLHQEGFLKEKPRIEMIRFEQKVIATFSPQQIARIVNRKPVGCNETRIHAMALTALDAGPRLQELLNLTRQDVDFDNLVLRIKGKGNKQRLVPMSIELRKVLFRYLAKHNHSRLFCTSMGTGLTPRNADRDFKVMCGKLGFDRAAVRCSFHTLRHSFAVNYLRKGGNLYYLQRILGHSSITTTERYLRSLGIEDLKKVHDGLTLLSR